MTMKVKAIEKKLKFSKDPNDPGVYRYVMSPELYIALSQEKVIKEAVRALMPSRSIRISQ